MSVHIPVRQSQTTQKTLITAFYTRCQGTGVRQGQAESNKISSIQILQPKCALKISKVCNQVCHSGSLAKGSVCVRGRVNSNSDSYSIVVQVAQLVSQIMQSCGAVAMQ